MIDDDAEYEQRRQIRSQADADVAAFIESLGQDEGSGVPPPPTIKVSEVSSQPVELDFIGFGQQGSSTAPGAGSIGGGSPPTGACCHRDGTCTEETNADCVTLDGQFRGVGSVCEYGQCGTCCRTNTCDEGFVLCGIAGESCVSAQTTLSECTDSFGGRYVDGGSEAACNDNSCCDNTANFVCCTPEQFCCSFSEGDYECSGDPCPEGAAFSPTP